MSPPPDAEAVAPTPPARRVNLPFDGTMPAAAAAADRIPTLAFVDSCLRGTGQIALMNNPATGLLLLAGMFVFSAWLGTATVVGVAAATAAAHLLRLERAHIRAGLYGYNGGLVGAALATFVAPAWSGVVLGGVVLAAAASTAVALALQALLSKRAGLPPLTLAFNLVTLPALLASSALVRTDPAIAAAAHDAQTGGLGAAGFGEAVLCGLGQLFFVASPTGGLFILAGLLVCSRIAAGFGLIGSAAGALLGLLLGAPREDVLLGLWGYNGFITAVAIAGVFLVLDLRSALFGVCAAVAATLLHAALAAALGGLSLPALTLPFCLATLAFLLAGGKSPLFRPVPLARVTTPEEHRRLAPG